MSGKPDMRVSLGGLELKNPVIAASGTFGYGREYSPFFDPARLGGLVVKGISLKPREGNPPPRIAETAGGMLNAIGLANLGVEAFIAEKLPWLARQDTAVVVNLYAESVDEFGELAGRLAGLDGVAALELNVSCPNVKAGGMAFGCDPGPVGQVTQAAVEAAGDTPVWVKLTPNVADPVPVALAAAQAGARAVCLINTLLGMAIDARTRKPVLANVFGGLSGPAIKPVGLRMVWQVRGTLAAQHPGVDLVGMGGIASGVDAAEYMLAGATAVQVGTASFSRPDACLMIAQELGQFCAEESVARVSDLTGGLNT